MQKKNFGFEDLDGFYQLAISTTPIHDELFPVTNAHIVVTNGKFAGMDIRGTLFVGQLSLTAQNTIALNATAHLGWADEDIVITGKDGTLTKDAQSYQTELSLIDHNGSVQLSGAINHGVVRHSVILVRISPLRKL